MIRNSYILKTIALFLSFWMFFASAGLSIDFHYCEGKIVDWSVFGGEPECDHDNKEIKEVDSCCEATQKMTCHEGEAEIQESNCCDSDQTEIIIENEFNISSEEVEYTVPVLFLASFFIQLEIIEDNLNYLVEDQQKPPIPINRKLASLQSFLI